MKKTIEPLRAADLRDDCNLEFLPFETTADLDILDGVIEQERAVRSLKTGLSINKRNYNIFVAGWSGTGRTTIVRSIVNEFAARKPTPPDWVYVQNFREKESPIPIRLPPGKGRMLARDMDEFVSFLQEELPSAFRSREHQEDIQDLVSDSLSEEQDYFSVLSQKAGEIGFSVKSTKNGLVTVPVEGDKVLSNKEYEALSEEDKKRIEERRRLLDPHIHEFVSNTRQIEHRTQERIKKKQYKLARSVVTAPMRKVRRRYSRYDGLKEYFSAVIDNVLDNLGRFIREEGTPTVEPNGREFTDYRVNVVVDNSDLKGAPIMVEARPNYYNLFGKIEKKVENGVYFTDFTMVKSGTVLKANGGYLLINTNDLFAYGSLVWDNLKSVMRYRQSSIEDIGEHLGYLPTSGLKPKPIPIDVKIILVGPSHVYELLHRHDEDFRKLFQIKSEFDYEMGRAEKNIAEYARFVATTCKNEDLRPVNREGVAAIVEFGSRLAESQRRVTLQFNQICNLLIEADQIATEEEDSILDRRHIEEAIRQRAFRLGLVEEKIRDEILDETVFIDNTGSAVGTINGLAVYEIGDYSFGKPSRITAVVYAGKGGIVNVERESRMSGRIHSKGVLIISGYLGAKFGQTRSPSLSVSLCFEQSYGSIDGDSASAAELFSVLSALSGLPIDQSFAVTGSVNQRGDIQPVGGINEKIEAWFELCRRRGFTGEQGVIIPHSNVKNLMLRPEILEAVNNGLFRVYAIDRVEQGIEILMGKEAGVLNDQFEFEPVDSVMHLADATLRRYDEITDDGDDDEEDADGL